MAQPECCLQRGAIAVIFLVRHHRVSFWRWADIIAPGIFFADDPAFAGRRRELVAQDYVYSYKRFADPATTSPGWSTTGRSASCATRGRGWCRGTR